MSIRGETPRAPQRERSQKAKTVEKKATLKTKKGISDEDRETINSLRREQERLNEELKAERKKSEQMKTLYSTDLNYYANVQKTAFTNLQVALSKLRSKDPQILEVQRLLGEYLENDSPFVPDTPRVTELANEAKEAELANDKAKRDNRQLKISYKQLCDELEGMRQQISEAEEKFEQLKSSRKEVKEKLHSLIDKAKRREGAWKEKIAALEAQIDAQE